MVPSYAGVCGGVPGRVYCVSGGGVVEWLVSAVVRSEWWRRWEGEREVEGVALPPSVG